MLYGIDKHAYLQPKFFCLGAPKKRWTTISFRWKFKRNHIEIKKIVPASSIQIASKPKSNLRFKENNDKMITFRNDNCDQTTKQEY